jgi:hypothetical protein
LVLLWKRNSTVCEQNCAWSLDYERSALDCGHQVSPCPPQALPSARSRR